MAHYRPPKIIPNYGKKKSVLPKSNISHVILHENTSQQSMLDAKIRQISREENRTERILRLHKTSFIVQQSLKQQQLRAMGITHLSFLPDIVAEAHVTMNKCGNGGSAEGRKMLVHTSRKKPKSRELTKVASLTSLPQEGLDDADRENESVTSSVKLARLTQSALPSNGITKSFNTFQAPMRREKTFGFSGEHKPQVLFSLQDPRFRQLEETLARLPQGVSMDGYLRLSPSGRRVMRKYCTYNPWLLPESRRTSAGSCRRMESQGNRRTSVDTQVSDLDVNIEKEYQNILKITDAKEVTFPPKLEIDVGPNLPYLTEKLKLMEKMNREKPGNDTLEGMTEGRNHSGSSDISR